MKKKISAITIGVIWLLLSLSLVISTPTVPPVKADGQNYASVIHTTDVNTTDTDKDYITWACNEIHNLFAQQYYVYYYWYMPVYGHNKNFRAQTTTSIVQSQIQDCEANHGFATVLYIGHGGKEGIYGEWEDPFTYSFYEAQLGRPNNTIPAINDRTHIYPKTVNGRHYFVFLWVCRAGDEAGNASPPHGMAYCWTRQPDLSPDGYGDPQYPENPDSRPYCFMGFQDASPRLSEWLYGNNKYKHWLVFFYYFALYYQYYYTLNDALDLASYMVGFQNGMWLDPSNKLSRGFITWWPYDWPPGTYGEQEGKMRIYGNGNTYIPAKFYW